MSVQYYNYRLLEIEVEKQTSKKVEAWSTTPIFAVAKLTFRVNNIHWLLYTSMIKGVWFNFILGTVSMEAKIITRKLYKLEVVILSL